MRMANVDLRNLRYDSAAQLLDMTIPSQSYVRYDWRNHQRAPRTGLRYKIMSARLDLI